MEKRSKVTNVSSNGHWDSDKGGRLYKFIVTFENGDSGQYQSKEQVQSKFVIGQEADYTIETKGQYTNIKPVYQQKPGFAKASPEEKAAKEKAERKRQYMIMLQSSTDYAIKVESELIDIAMKYLVAKGEKPTADDIQAVRDILYPQFIANIQSSQTDILKHILSETKKQFKDE